MAGNHATSTQPPRRNFALLLLLFLLLLLLPPPVIVMLRSTVAFHDGNKVVCMREELGFRIHETRCFSLQSPLLLQDCATYADIFPLVLGSLCRRFMLLLPLAVTMLNINVSDFEVPHHHTCELLADKDRGITELSVTDVLRLEIARLISYM